MAGATGFRRPRAAEGQGTSGQGSGQTPRASVAPQWTILRPRRVGLIARSGREKSLSVRSRHSSCGCALRDIATRSAYRAIRIKRIRASGRDKFEGT